MKKYLFIFIALIFFLFQSCSDESNPVNSQNDDNEIEVKTPVDPNAPEVKKEWEDWIKVNANKIESITSENFEDLQFFKTIILNKSIIQLGESTHGAKEFNQSKVRFIKFLHQEMGFNIIAFESSVFDCFYGNNSAKTNSASDLMGGTIYGVWHTREVLELFNYVKSTQASQNPLRIVGFDMKPSGSSRLSRSRYLRDALNKLDAQQALKVYELDSYMINNNLYYSQTAPEFLSIKDSLLNDYQEVLNFLVENWDEFLTQYPSGSDIPHIVRLTIKSNIAGLNFYEATQRGSGQSTRIRDMEMAYNLEYLFRNVYNDEKFIVWAHNFHIRHDNARTNSGVNTMGYYLKNSISLNAELYTIGFYMYKGRSAYNDKTPAIVTPCTSQNIEAIFYRTRHHYSFVDMFYQAKNDGNSWMFESMNLKSWGISEISMIARNQYDGLFFVYETSMPDYVSTSKGNFHWP